MRCSIRPRQSAKPSGSAKGWPVATVLMGSKRQLCAQGVCSPGVPALPRQLPTALVFIRIGSHWVSEQNPPLGLTRLKQEIIILSGNRSEGEKLVV
jgi:hypothetical protein